MKLYIFLILILVYSCSMHNLKESKNMENNSIQRVWMMTKFKSYTKEQLIEKKAQLDIKTDSFANAFMGCNNIVYSYRITSPNKIYFTNGIQTQMACVENNLETEFNIILPNLTEYNISGHTLILKSTKGDIIEFIAQDWD